MPRFIALLACLFSFSLAAQAQNFGASDALSSNEDSFLSVEEAYLVRPQTRDGVVTFQWAIADGYYLYRHQFAVQAESASETLNLEMSMPDGKRKYDEIFQEELEVYYGSHTLSVSLPDWPQPFELTLQSQGCADAGLCYPPRTQRFKVGDSGIVEIEASELIKAESEAKVASESIQSLADAPTGSTPWLPMVLLFALVGGMILNLMPCVFPVLSLKALSLSGGDSRQHRINGWAYTVGVVVSFVLVAVIILVARSAGTSLGWGFQLQQPGFVAFLVYLFFLLGMNFSGALEISGRFAGLGQQLTEGHGPAPSFFTGVLAAVVASPCTAPFMATAIGFTLSQSAAIALLVFVCLGFGMALPYLILSHSPALAARLPQPGSWMITFKQALSFPLFFTCVWLLVVFGNQTSAKDSAMLVGGAIALMLTFWIWQKQPSGASRWFVRGLALVSLIATVHVTLDAIRSEEEQASPLWQAYSPETLSTLRAEGRAVFVDLTADWCITCKINEKVALDVHSVEAFAQSHDITLLRGDWTRADPDITALLHEFERNGVPLYLMYPADSQAPPEVLPQILTPGLVIDAMRRASGAEAL